LDFEEPVLLPKSITNLKCGTSKSYLWVLERPRIHNSLLGKSQLVPATPMVILDFLISDLTILNEDFTINT
jgi:hypothetical protein